MSKATSSQATKISSLVLVVIFITLALSLTALYLAVSAHFMGDEMVSGYLLLIGALGVALSTYMLFQTRRRILRLRIKIPPVTTLIEGRKCGF